MALLPITIFNLCCIAVALRLLFILLKPILLKHVGHPRATTHMVPLPPGPPQIPIIGSILHLLLGARRRQELQLPHSLFRSLSATYGPLVHLKLGQVSVIVASSPAAAREIMKAHDANFATRPVFTAVKIMSYGGQTMSFAPYGEYWRQLRRICILELLSPKRILSFRSIREEEVDGLVNSLSRSDHPIVDLSKALGSMTNDIMARATVGSKCRYDQRGFLEALEEEFEIGAGFDLADFFPSCSCLLGSLTGVKARAERCHRRLDRILDDIIQQHKHKGAREDDEDEAEDLLDVLLRLQQDGGLAFDLTTDRIKAVILDMLGPGTESASTILEWAMSELMRNPRVMRRAEAEVRGAFRGQSRVTEDGVKELSYLGSVIKETLRLHPPGPLLLPRECGEECEVLGHRIPAGARVVVNVWAMGRDPRYWEEAERFRPERFEGSTVDFRGADFEFLPFGSGRRMCPGMSFGLANLELPLAQLLHCFDWELPDGIEPGELDMTETFGLSAGRKSHLLLRCHPRFPLPA